MSIDWPLVYVFALLNYGGVLFTVVVAGPAAPRAPVDSDTSSRFYWFNTERPNTTHIGDDLLFALLGVFSTPAIAGGYLFAFYAETDAFAAASVNYFYVFYLLRVFFIVLWAVGFYRWTLHTGSVLLSSTLLLLTDAGLLCTLTYVATIADAHQISYAVAAMLVAFACVFCDFFAVVCYSIVHLAWRSAVFSTIAQQAVGRGLESDDGGGAEIYDDDDDDDDDDEAIIAHEEQRRQMQLQQMQPFQAQSASTRSYSAPQAAKARSSTFTRMIEQQQLRY